MKITREQIEFIREHIQQNGIITHALQDDVLDHVCCTLEGMDERETDFSTAFKHAIHEVAPNGLRNLQRETSFLLNSPIQISMKKFMFIIGALSASATVMGLNFRLLHLQGSDTLLTWGQLTFTMIFIPLLAWDRFRMRVYSTRSEKWRWILGVCSACLTGLAILARLFYISDGFFLFVGGAVIFSFGFLPLLFVSMYKKSIAH